MIELRGGSKTLHVAFPEWLLREMGRLGLTQAEVARRGGITTAQLSRVVNGDSKPGPKTIAAVAKALEIPEGEVYIQAGLQKKPAAWDSDMEELIEVARGLDKASRDEILDFARLKLHRHRAKNNADSKANKRASAS